MIRPAVVDFDYFTDKKYKQKMRLSILTFITSLAIAGVAAWYSIIGLTTIFSAAVIPIIIMGVVLEIGKLVAAAWVYQNWKETKIGA